VQEREELGLVVDLSAAGIRLEGPSVRRRESPIVQLEFELPDADEIVWAKGEVCFDRYHRASATGPFVRTTGVRLAAAAARHVRMLRDWVMAAVDAQRAAEEARLNDRLAFAACFRD
jgi:hypothetical protein